MRRERANMIKFTQKIIISMSILIMFIFFISAYIIFEMNIINKNVGFIATNRINNITLLGKINTVISRIRISEIEYIRHSSSDKRNFYRKNIASYNLNIIKNMEEISKLLMNNKARTLLEGCSEYLKKYITISNEMLRLADEDNNTEASILLDNASRNSYLQIRNSLEELEKEILINTAASRTTAENAYTTALRMSIILTALAISIAVFLTIKITRETHRQLGKDPGELQRLALRVAQSDYTIDDGTPKTGVYASLVEMANTLKQTIQAVHEESENAKKQADRAYKAMEQAEAAQKISSEKTEAMLHIANELEILGSVLSSASTELSAQIEQSERGAQESSHRLTEAATAIQEMNATVQEVAKNAGTASASSLETKKKANEGAVVVKQAVQGIGEVYEMSMSLKGDMVQLNERVQDISQIMGVISDIADQTNLLALNAAIEAARAGEAGRGFAVVADEVRKLAEKTMSSTNDVGNAIQSIQDSTTKSMKSMDSTVRRVGEVTELAQQSGQALQEIVNMMDSAADQVNAIATASEEQSAASEEINQAILQVSDMSRQTAESMDQAAQAVSSLSDQAQALTGLIEDLKKA